MIDLTATFRATAIPLALVTAAFASGCVVALGAAVGAGAVHTSGEDAARVVLEHTWDDVFDACADEIERRGAIDLRDRDGGTLVGFVETARVDITLTRSSEHTVEVTVTARRDSGFTPDRDLAFEIVTAVRVALDQD